MNDNEITKKEDMIKNEIINISYFPEVKETKLGLVKYDKLPIAEIASYGTAWQDIAKLFNRIGEKSDSTLCRVTIPKGQHLATLRDGTGNISTLLDKNNRIVGQARMETLPFDTLSFDPTMFIIAGVVANIEKKLNLIIDLQTDMMNFIIQKERSEIKGNLTFMMDVLKNYKYNIDNKMYKINCHIKVLDICQNAEGKINFYRERIISKTNKNDFFSTDGTIKKKVDSLIEDFEDYQFSLYLYSFSAYLGIILLENYSSAYLNELSVKISNYSKKYRNLYTDCYNQIEGYQRKTTTSIMRKGISSISKKTGHLIEKTPLLGNTSIDENLIKVSYKVKDYDESKTLSNLSKLVDYQKSSVQHFIDNIQHINNINNGNLEIYVDSENIYVNANKLKD